MSKDKESAPHRDSREALEKGAMMDSRIQEVHAQLMREKEEPVEGFSPVPIFLLFIFGALVFWGGVYLAHNSGDFRWDAYSPDFKGDTKAVVAEFDPIKQGKKVFTKQCALCHQATGAGVPGVYPPLFGSDWVTGSEERLAKILVNGLNGPIEVAGATYNGNMPAFGSTAAPVQLKNRDIAAVLTYIRQEWGNAAAPVSEERVAQMVADYGSRTAAWTAEELLELHPME